MPVTCALDTEQGLSAGGSKRLCNYHLFMFKGNMAAK